MKTVFHANDLIVPSLKFPDPCPISIQIKEKDIVLHVGQRDWQWDLKDGHLVGSGCCVIPSTNDLTKSQESRLKARRERISQRMGRDRKRRLRKGTSPPGDDLISMQKAREIIGASKNNPKN